MGYLQVRDVGDPQAAGAERGQASVTLVVLGDDPSPPESALAAYAAPRSRQLPHYYIDRRGEISRLMDERRAGRGLGAAIYQGFAQKIDPQALHIVLEKRPTAGYDGPQLRAIYALLDELFARHSLDNSALARLVPDSRGVPQVRPYVPPPAPRLAR